MKVLTNSETIDVVLWRNESLLTSPLWGRRIIICRTIGALFVRRGVATLVVGFDNKHSIPYVRGQ